jgi:dTDP-glucose 4,6-dehydratase
MIIVTDGAEFIGANFILQWCGQSDKPVLNLNVLAYAGNPENLRTLADSPRYRFIHDDFTDASLLRQLFAEQRPRPVVHFAAESHVDRSIHGPEAFVQTNVVGTLRLLEADPSPAIDWHYLGNTGLSAKNAQGVSFRPAEVLP